MPKDFKEPDLKGAKAVAKPVFSRKEKLADWVVGPDNPPVGPAHRKRSQISRIKQLADRLLTTRHTQP